MDGLQLPCNNEREEYEQRVAELTAQVESVRRETWEAAIGMLKQKAEQWREAGERWAKHASTLQDEKLRDLDYSDRDQCFAQMSAAKVLIFDFEAAAAQGSK